MAALSVWVLLGVVSSLLSLPLRWLLARRWSNVAPRAGALAAIGAAEAATTVAVLLLLLSFGVVAGAYAAVACVLLLAAGHRALLPGSELRRVATLGVVWPATYGVVLVAAYWWSYGQLPP